MKKERIKDDLDLTNDFTDELDENRSSYSRSPQSTEYDVFYLRNNPEPLIVDFYLYLTNQVKNADPDKALTKPFISVGKALMNKQGVRDLVNLMQIYVNGHTVQTNLNAESLNRMMRHTADDIATFMVNSIDDWECEERYIRSIQNELLSKIELFLRRGLDDKEREHYSQEQTHDYSHVSGGDKKKKSLGLPSGIKKMFSE